MEKRPLEDTNTSAAEGGSDKMKIKISNIPSSLGVSQVRKFVANSLGIPMEAVNCRKAPKWPYAYLNFKPTQLLSVASDAAAPTTAADLEAIRRVLHGRQWKKNVIDATIEGPASETEDKKRRKLEGGSREIAPEKSLHDQVTPLWRMPYEEQVALKHDKLKNLLQKNYSNDFQMDAIVASPQTNGYRNKCEFTVALNKDGLPTVGFLLGGFRDGVTIVENAKDCVHVPDVLKELANHLQVLVRSTPDLLPFDRREKRGFWRLMLARVHDGDVMAAVQIDASNKDEGIIEQIKDHFMRFSFEGVNPVKSFFIQQTAALHHGIDMKAPFILLFGSETITQTLCDLRFRISPLSFFQVNPPATELLYSIIKDYAIDKVQQEKGNPTILLDLCCGTGTIGMTLAASVERVIGVEIVKEAIEDAKINAEMNGVTNMIFECNPVEKAIERIIAGLPANADIVVILDPPRSGVHSSVVKAIRKAPRIARLVYVACNPEAVMGNFNDLTKIASNAFPGIPFTLQKAVAVDLFPQTEHCELVAQFARPN